MPDAQSGQGVGPEPRRPRVRRLRTLAGLGSRGGRPWRGIRRSCSGTRSGCMPRLGFVRGRTEARWPGLQSCSGFRRETFAGWRDRVSGTSGGGLRRDHEPYRLPQMLTVSFSACRGSVRYVEVVRVVSVRTLILGGTSTPTPTTVRRSPPPPALHPPNPKSRQYGRDARRYRARAMIRTCG